MEFGALPLEAFDKLADPIDRLMFESGAHLYRQGALCVDHLYSLRSGWVKLVQNNEEGCERIVRLMGPGAVLGHGLLYSSPETYAESAIALGEVDVCRIPLSTMRELNGKYPALVDKIARSYEEHLKRANQVIVSFSTGRLHDRIVHVLKFQAAEFSDYSGKFPLFSGSDYAELVGASEESVSRVLAALKRANALVRQDRGLFVFNAERVGD